MILFDAEDRCCETCRWWKPWGESTGVCTSVLANEYASADLVREEGDPGRVLLVTNAEFACRDWAAGDGDAG